MSIYLCGREGTIELLACALFATTMHSYVPVLFPASSVEPKHVRGCVPGSERSTSMLVILGVNYTLTTLSVLVLSVHVRRVLPCSRT